MAEYSNGGSVEPFQLDNATGDDWEEWTEILEEYFKSEEIEDNEDNKVRRRGKFLSSVGKDTYKLMKKLVAPAKIKDKTMQQLITLVQNHLQPKPSAIVARYHFNTAVRGEESVSKFIAELRKLVSKCAYSTTYFANEMLRDRLVAGIRHDRILTKLLSEPDDLTFDRAVSLAVSTEAALANAKQLMGEPEDNRKQENVYRVPTINRRPSSFNQERICYCCGGKGHLKPDCTYLEYECNICKKRGHLAKICRAQDQEGARHKQKSVASTKYMYADPVQEVSDEELYAVEAERMVQYAEEYEDALYSLEGNGGHEPPMVTTLKLNGKSLEMNIDTGASNTIVPETVFEAALREVCPSMSKTGKIMTT